MKRKENKVEIFCDGSCYSKHPDKLGGYGVYAKWNGQEHCYREGFKSTTIYRMELRALLKSLRILKNIRCIVLIYSDSQSVVDMIIKKAFLWKSGQLGSIDSFDLINSIFKEIERLSRCQIKLKWTKGHKKEYGNPIVQGNYIADSLACYKTQKEYKEDVTIF